MKTKGRGEKKMEYLRLADAFMLFIGIFLFFLFFNFEVKIYWWFSLILFYLSLIGTVGIIIYFKGIDDYFLRFAVPIISLIFVYDLFKLKRKIETQEGKRK